MFRPGELAACNGNNTCYRVIERRAALGPGVFNLVVIPAWLVTISDWSEAKDIDILTLREENFFRPPIQAKDPAIEMQKRYALDDENKLSYMDSRALVVSLEELPFEWNGHFKNGVSFIGHPRELFTYIRAFGIPKDAAQLLKGKTDTFFALGEFNRAECPNCTVKLTVTTNGEVVRIGQPCPRPEGVDITEFEINVPSGKLIVANDLRDLFPISCDYDINRTIGCHMTTLDYAAGGLAHGYVGNSCPSFRKGVTENTFVIANIGTGFRIDPKTYEETKLDPPPTFEAGRSLTTICTDLWWYSICDAAEFDRRCAWKKLKPKTVKASHDCDTVKVKPGVYRFRHNNIRQDDLSGQPTYYTRIEWVREPDPVQDLLSAYTEQPAPTAAQFLLQSIRNYPTLYSNGKKWKNMSETERTKALALAANHLMCCGGNGIDWHENGFPIGQIDKDLPDIGEIPLFNFRTYWSGLNREYTPMGQVCGHKCGIRDTETMTPSFVQLSLNVLASLVSYGDEPQEHDEKRYVTKAREELALAAEMYRELRSTFPEVSPPDPEFDVWVSDPERVRHWVKNFEFGDGIWWRYKQDGSVEHEHKPKNV
jgi:hypothetical protein